MVSTMAPGSDRSGRPCGDSGRRIMNEGDAAMTRSRKTMPKRHAISYWFVLAAALATWWAWSWWTAPSVVVRVLFSETANCSSDERRLVVGVMENRIGHAAFGSLASMAAVVRQPGAFSCINDPDNGNWVRTRHLAQMTPAEQVIWAECVALVYSDLPLVRGPSGRPLVYYHDKGIAKPTSWDGPQWRAVHELSTEHLVFYSIVDAHS